MSEARTEALDIRGMKLACHLWGAPANGEAIIFVHGFTDHGRSFALVEEHLSKSPFVVAPDMRGHGESDWVGAGGNYHFYDYFDDVVRVFDAFDVQRCTLVGHSMGGAIVGGVAAMIPDRVERLVLLEGIGPMYTEPSDTVPRFGRWSTALRQPWANASREDRKTQRRVMKDLEEAASRLQRMNDRLDQTRALRLARTFTEPYEDGVSWRFDPLHRAPSSKGYLQVEADAIWAGVKCPTLFLYGCESPFKDAPFEARLKLIDGLTQCFGVPDAGHNLHHDQPELIARIIDAWRAGADLPTDKLKAQG